MAGEKGEKTQLYFKGANSDVNIEMQSLGEGVYISAVNMRLSEFGDNKILTGLKNGEEIYSDSISTDLTTLGIGLFNWNCYGGIECNHHILLFFYNDLGWESFISIDGRVMMFTDTPKLFDSPLQIIANENASGGEVYMRNEDVVPLIFNVQDIITEWNAGVPTTKYFVDFDVRLYKAQLTGALNVPVFIDLESVGGNNGLPRGGYSYSMRYVNNDGVGTEWSVPTPVIPVVEKKATVASKFHVDAGVYGGVTDLTNPTKYGIKLKIRVTNEGGFSYIELKRLSYNLIQSFEFVPAAEKTIITTVNILSNPYTIVEFTDTASIVWTTLDEAELESFSAIEKTNSVTYFDNRLIEMGPTYESRIVSSAGLFLAHNQNDKVAYPVIDMLHSSENGTENYGYVDIWNQVYRKGYMRGEKYGWAVVVKPVIGGESFAIPYYDGSGATGIGDFRNYKLPERRETISDETSYASRETVYCADLDSHDNLSNSQTHEVFDQEGNTNVKEYGGEPFSVLAGWDRKNIAKGAFSLNYKPLTPTGSEGDHSGNSTDLSGLSICPNVAAEGAEISANTISFANTNPDTILDAGAGFLAAGFAIGDVIHVNNSISNDGVYTIANVVAGTITLVAGDALTVEGAAGTIDIKVLYDPQGGNPRIFALGMMFQGIDNSLLPDWGAGFSIVRTAPAGRIICQGLATYDLTKGPPATKDLDSFWFYSPDIDPALNFNSGLFDQLIESGRDYQIQLVSPLGFWSELYSGSKSPDYSVIDFISYAKMFYENKLYSHADANTVIGWQDGYVSFGRWRNDLVAGGGNVDMSADIFSNTNDFIFNITGISKNTVGPGAFEGRSSYLQIGVAEDMYKTSNPVGTLSTHATVTKWHEPVYVVNIIDPGADVDVNLNIQKYYHTGHYQKLNSIIGFGLGTAITLDLVDERYEDAVVDHVVYSGYHTPAGASATVLTDAFKTWVTNELVGYTIINTTDHSWAIILSNTLNTATVGSLSGGQWDQNDTYIIIKERDYVYKGLATNGAPGAVLQDTTKTWVADELIGYTLKNITTGAWTVITDNDATTVTGVMAGGTSANWTLNDEYWISANRYVYVNNKPWLANIPLGKYATIVAALGGAGLWNDGNRNVYGVCRGETVDNKNARISFDNTYFDNTYGGAIATALAIPANKDRIEVRYDNRIAIKLFGGDTFVNESIWADIDANIEWNDGVGSPGNQDKCFHLGVAFPFYDYVTHPDWYRVSLGNTAAPDSNERIQLDYIRQHAWQFICESRANLNLLANDVFPKKHYVMRPIIISDTDIALGAADVYDDNDVHAEYEDDYGDEYLLWPYGGFKFPVIDINKGYSASLNGNVSYSHPLIGFEEQLYFPNKILFSSKRILPGVAGAIKMFPVLNSFEISDFTGEIKYAYYANTSNGDNLYAITENGVCLLITNKRLLYQMTGERLGTIGADQFILSEYWISVDHGMGDWDVSPYDFTTWTSAAKYENMLFWCNKQSVYALIENKVLDIGRVGYYNKLKELLLDHNTVSLAGAINRENYEYWLLARVAQGGGVYFTYIFIYDILEKVWVGYMYDASWSAFINFVETNKAIYGIENSSLDFYLMDSGSYLDCEVLQAISPVGGKDVEFVDIKINSDNKPTSVEFADIEKNLYQCILNAGKGTKYLKDYGYYYNKIPRKEQEYTGTHTGASNVAVLTDSTQAWAINELIGMTVYNDTDGSSAVITANTVNTVTGILVGGTQNDWDLAEVYHIVNTKSFRLQGRHMVFRITHSANEPFRLTSTTTGYKVLKIK